MIEVFAAFFIGIGVGYFAPKLKAQLKRKRDLKDWATLEKERQVKKNWTALRARGH